MNSIREWTAQTQSWLTIIIFPGGRGQVDYHTSRGGIVINSAISFSVLYFAATFTNLKEGNNAAEYTVSNSMSSGTSTSRLALNRYSNF